jgi:hypothetical protein
MYGSVRLVLLALVIVFAIAPGYPITQELNTRWSIVQVPLLSLPAAP